MGRLLNRTQSFVPSYVRPIAVVVGLFLFYQLTRLTFPSNANKKDITKTANSHPHISRALVIAATETSNLTWLEPALKDAPLWKPYVYITDAQQHKDGQLKVPVNKGNEAMVYLTYIIDHYYSLPDVVFFHHHHHQAWHQQYSSSFELAHLNVKHVQRHGYVSPRCLPGCENVIKLGQDVVPLNELGGWQAQRDVLISSVLAALWRKDGRDVPKEIAAPCCAQFAVSREMILAEELGTWKALREWLIETNVNSAAAGRVLEYTWHLWFGMEPKFCPDEKICLCDVYGVGDCSSREL